MYVQFVSATPVRLPNPDQQRDLGIRPGHLEELGASVAIGRWT